MSKSDKYTSKVPKLEDVTLAFVGEDGAVDEEKAKKVLHTLMTDKAKAQDAREDALTETKEAESKVTELQSALDDKSGPDAKVELDKARAAQAKAEAERDLANSRADRVEIAAEKGLTPSQAKRLIGSNREELEADADQLVTDLGIGKQDEEGEEEGRTVPRSGLRTGGDPNPLEQGGTGPVDYEAAAAQIVSRNHF